MALPPGLRRGQLCGERKWSGVSQGPDSSVAADLRSSCFLGNKIFCFRLKNVRSGIPVKHMESVVLVHEISDRI